MIPIFWTKVLFVLGLVFGAAWIIAFMHERDIRPVQDLVAIFRRQSKVGRVLLVTFFIAMWVIGGTKPGNGGGEGGGTNGVQTVISPGDGLQPLDSPGSATNSQQGLTGGLAPVAGGALGASPSVTDVWEGFTPITSTNTTRTLDADDFRRGFVLTGIGTDEEHGFDAPPGATVCADWLAFGATEDWIYLAFTDWAFRLGTNEVDRLRVFSFGRVDPLPPATNGWFAPFRAPLGIVPAANWHLIPQSSNPPDPQPLNPSTSQHSCFWHLVTPSNTLQLTWQNALFGRLTNTPVSVQMEVWPSGRFVYRYDLSRCGGLGETALPNGGIADILVGASLGGLAWATNALQTNLTSLAFSPLFPEDAVDPDRDGDGLATIDELFAYGTDPGSADTDMDGLLDREELDVTHTDPLDAHTLSPLYPDGVAVVIGDEDPWSIPEGSTNTVWEHIFYTGTTNGPFAYPRSTDTHAVFEVTVSGPGSGELAVGGTVIPLLAPPQTRSSPSPATSTLYASVRKGVTYPVYLRADGTPVLTVTSSDFAFGVMPSLAEGRFAGRINFPNVKATEPCIHDLNACRTSVTLPVGADADGVTCTWHGSGDVEVESRPPRSALLTGTFSPKGSASVTYTLAHPLRLCGRTDYVQTMRFCPHLPDGDEEPEREPGAVPLPDGGDGGDGSGGMGGDSGGGSPDGSGIGGEDGYPHAEDGDPWRDPDNGDDSTAGGPGSGGGTGGGPDAGGGSPIPDPETCPEHGDGYAECQAVHDAEYAEASAALPALNGVLLIRSPTLYGDIQLEAPASGAPMCCPCPSHASNFVAAAYVSSRLSLIGGEGAPFGRSAQSCTVHVGGVMPSEAVGDARLMFATNGATCLDVRYTVFGVGVSAPILDLGALNALNPAFGLPVAVGTNAPTENLELDLKVKLPDGRVRLSFSDATGPFRLLYRSPHDGLWHTLIDSETQPVRDMSAAEWRRLFGKRAGAAFSAPVAVVASSAGHCDLSFRYWRGGGPFAEDAARQRITAVDPPLMADITRDGSIDAADVAAYVSGGVFRCWINEDTAKGDYVGQNPDLTPNANNHMVDGRLDLVNLFPVKLDLKPFIDAWGSTARFQIYAPDGSLNFCGVAVAPETAGALQTNGVYTTAGDPLHAAELTEVTYEGVDIAPADYLGNNNAPGVLAFEAKGAARPTLAVLLGDDMVFQFELPISLSSVRDMYRWRNLRPICNGSCTDPDAIGVPSNMPNGETDGKDVFFLHGFNVSEAEARNWANQVFKRLWLSGSKARFHGVAWYGDYHLVSGTFNGLHYHQDVYHALQTAYAFKLYAEAVQSSASSRIVMAHSLGNMVASEALKQGLQVCKYFMFNAAIASEAFDGTLQAQSQTDDCYAKYVPDDWHGYTNMCWAANWHRWFDANDARSEMGWPDRFSSALNNAESVCNYYSSGDEIFEEMLSTPSALNGVFHWPTLQAIWNLDLSSLFTPSANAWQKQEVLKGVDNVAGTLAGGWGFHYVSNSTPSVTTWRIYTPEEACAMTEDGSIVTNAVFARDVPAMFNSSATQDAQFETLAKYIPAISTATGKRHVGSDQLENSNLNGTDYRNGWGRDHPQYGASWLHSDMKNMAYWYVSPFYNSLIEALR